MTTKAQKMAWARRATYASVAVSSVLIAIKGVAYYYSDSVAMLSSLVDTMLDVLASVINLFAIRHAQTPADEDHRFGHGKAEALAGLGQSAFVGGSAAFLVLQAAERLIHPAPVAAQQVGIVVSVIAIVLTLALVLFQRWVLKRTGSLIVAADSLHYVSDLLFNVAVIAALVLAGEFGWVRADPIFGLLLAFYIVSGSWSIMRQSLDHLMDRELSEDVRENIRSIVLAHPDALSVHDLRTRVSGNHTFIQFHLEMDGSISLHRAHEIADEIERNLLAAYPDAEIIIHEDPAGIVEDRRPSFAAH